MLRCSHSELPLTAIACLAKPSWGPRTSPQPTTQPLGGQGPDLERIAGRTTFLNPSLSMLGAEAPMRPTQPNMRLERKPGRTRFALSCSSADSEC